MGVTLPLEPLELLYEAQGLPSFDVPEQLRAHYGGRLGFARPRVFTNFVSSLDGVVAIPSLTQSSSIIADGSEADRFVMGLLRACADLVLIGSGTLRSSPASLWRAERVYPPGAAAFAELRHRLGAPAHPRVAVVTASGSIDAEHPVLAAGALVLTTEHGAGRLDGTLPPDAELVMLPGEHEVDLRAAIDALRARGHELILSEAGPALTGSLLAADLLDELFLTVSPVLAGRSRVDARPGFVEGHELLPGTRVAGRLTGVRRHGQHLFLRYDLRSPSTPDPAP